MVIQKIQIISNNICFGLMPSPDMEVEQHLTISRSGRIWFSGYQYGDGGDRFRLFRRCQLRLDQGVIDTMLDLFERFVSTHVLEDLATDIGSWEMKITDTTHYQKRIMGDLAGGVRFNGIDLTQYVREQIPIDGLFVFGDDFGC